MPSFAALHNVSSRASVLLITSHIGGMYKSPQGFSTVPVDTRNAGQETIDWSLEI